MLKDKSLPILKNVLLNTMDAIAQLEDDNAVEEIFTGWQNGTMIPSNRHSDIDVDFQSMISGEEDYE